MDNLAKWRHYLKDMVSPDSFINMGFYFMISAALQRRVWLGPPEMPMFPNMFLVLIGDPGVGKGLVTGHVANFLRHHKLRASPNKSTEADALRDELSKMKEEVAQKLANKKPSSFIPEEQKEEPLLFPMPADSTTFESLLRQNTAATRRIRTDIRNCLVPPSGVYTHQSMAFVLEELSSLFREQSQDLAKWLLNAWDCKAYKRETKHQGTDLIRTPCMSLLAGTTPGFIRETFTDKIIEDGLSARMIFVFEEQNRFVKFGVPFFTEEQHACKNDILHHLRVLSTLFGQVHFSPEAFEIMRKYFEEDFITGEGRYNKSSKLMPYYAKKNAQAMKLAMAIHFADNVDLMVGEEDVVKALDMLKGLEHKMHVPLETISSNRDSQAPLLGRVTRAVRQYHGKQVTMFQIWKDLHGDVKEDVLKECLENLVKLDRIKKVVDGGVTKYHI